MKKTLSLAALYAFPVVAFAQITDIESAIAWFLNILNLLIPVAIALAVVVFLFGIFRYVTAKDDTAKSEARSIILYGVVILFVMVAIWGLVNILINTFGLQTEPPPAPKVPQ
jgi:hypothetical protein